MDMQRLRGRPTGLLLGLVRVVSMRMSGAAVVVRVNLALPDTGQEQAKQRNSEQ
jgi:hypothetical protein